MIYKTIPTYRYETDTWSKTDFETKEDFKEFLFVCFKEPGEYGFDESSVKFTEEGDLFNKHGVYCVAPPKSKDFVEYWDTAKEKCRQGVIYHHKEKTWYLPREYYMWLNYLPIYDKEEGKFGFAKLRDAQYHLALYERLAEENNQHAAILKKRQIASSYFHAAKMINLFFFEEGSVSKIAGSLKDYINEKGTWRFLEEYRNFLNSHTAWYRPCNPDKILNWEQKIEINQGGRKRDVGLKSVIAGAVLDKDPTNGVGGPCTFFFHEEAGIAPKMNMTLEYLLPAMKSGMLYTGMFAVAGSVGDLEQCEPLKQMILHPESKDVYAVETKLLDDQGNKGMCGLFIPEQWSMLPCIDQYGNSLIEEALEMILKERLEWKEKLSPDDYRLRVSQKPINIKEAFDYRKDSKFNQDLVMKQIRRIEDKNYYTEYVDLTRNEKNEIDIKPSNKTPIMEFPISPRSLNKEGVIVMYERPIKDAPFLTYYASIDPVSEGKTTTSESLCSIFVYKNNREVTVHKLDGSISSHTERGKLVASWCGRFDDLNKTHERLELIIEAYNAWTVVENNVHLFIQYMIQKRKQKYLVPKSQIMFLKELGSNVNVFQEYGWKNTGTLFKSNLISYCLQFIEEEIDVETKPNGDIVKITFGIERIPDIMLLKEMQAYHDKLNVDRLVAFCALVAFVRVQESNRGFAKAVEKEDGKDLHFSNKSSNLFTSPFKTIGSNKKKKSGMTRDRNPFKTIR